MSEMNSGKHSPEQATQSDPVGKLVPPLMGEIRELNASWITNIGDALCRFPIIHFISLAVMAALVAVAWLVVHAGTALTSMGLVGALSVALLVCGFGFVALYASRNNVQTKQEYPDKPSQP